MPSVHAILDDAIIYYTEYYSYIPSTIGPSGPAVASLVPFRLSPKLANLCSFFPARTCFTSSRFNVSYSTKADASWRKSY